MNKHLKPGVAVDVRGASDEDVQAVIEVCKKLGANRNPVHGFNKGEFVIWDDVSDVWICYDSSKGYPIISISQALGRESEVESKSAIVGQSNASNDWVERGELPPVGTECEITTDHCGFQFAKSLDRLECEIVAHQLLPSGLPVAVFSYAVDDVNFELKYHSLVSECFRPLKTEKEKFVDAYYKTADETPKFETAGGWAAALYDAGYRKT